MDDRAQYAIAALAGHLGGANALARRVAELLGAQAVITTASDVGQTIAVDLLGRDLGWAIDSWDNVTKVSAAVVNGEAVGVLQETGEMNWWSLDRPLLDNVQLDGGVSKDRIGSIYQRLTLPQEDVVSLPLGELAEAGVEFTDLSIFVPPTVGQKP